MDELSQDVLRVAVLAGDHERGGFRAVLEDEGMEVVLDGVLEWPRPASWNGAGVAEYAQRPSGPGGVGVLATTFP